MDTRFSSAIHALILISEAERPMSSEQIAESVGTNASYIRRVTGLLKKRGIIRSSQGVSGFSLLIPPEQLSLYEIYRAVNEMEDVHIFDLHQNPNDLCIVGRHIRPTLSHMFRGIEEQAEREMKDTTLKDCMEEMRSRILQEENGEDSHARQL